jgi:hypothetical protein
MNSLKSLSAFLRGFSGPGCSSPISKKKAGPVANDASRPTLATDSIENAASVGYGAYGGCLRSFFSLENKIVLPRRSLCRIESMWNNSYLFLKSLCSGYLFCFL